MKTSELKIGDRVKFSLNDGGVSTGQIQNMNKDLFFVNDISGDCDWSSHWIDKARISAKIEVKCQETEIPIVNPKPISFMFASTVVNLYEGWPIINYSMEGDVFLDNFRGKITLPWDYSFGSPYAGKQFKVTIEPL